MIPTCTQELLNEYTIIKKNYDNAQDKFLKGINDNDLYVKCLNLSGECIKYLQTLNIFEINRIKTQVEEIYYIHAELLMRTIGLNVSRTSLKDNEKHVLIGCVNCLQQVLKLNPFSPKGKELFRVVMLYMAQYTPDSTKAIELLEQILVVDPCDFQLHLNLGFHYHKNNNLEKSLAHYKMALGILDLATTATSDTKVLQVLNEYKVKCLNGLGTIYFTVQDRELAKYFFYKALDINPNEPDIHNQLGVTFTELRFIDKAIYHYQKAINTIEHSNTIPHQQKMDLLSSIYMNMGLAICYECNFEQAVAYYNKALKYNPRLSLAYQNKLLDFNYISHLVEDPMYIAKLHKNINKIYPKVVTNWKESCPNYKIKKPNEQLKIGFVSGDFICHPVSYFINCILKHLDRNDFEIHCFSMKVIDLSGMHPNCQCHVIKNKNAEELKTFIQSQEIDILFDLSAHTGDNRLDTFVLKPAPIQISYCGYPGSSGINSIDYHITDRIADKPNFSEKYYSEKLIWMDKSFLCYTPNVELKELPKLSEQPCIKNNWITFGSFNRLNKINNYVRKTWNEILQKIPNARLVVKTKEFLTEKLKNQFFNDFDKNVIDRIIILPYSDLYTQHLPDYNKIDIALDTFPYSGTTTSCESLLMGVPVLTFYDNIKYYHSQNVTSSLMINCNLNEYVVNSQKEYIEKAIQLSKNLNRLQNLKQTTRDAFLNSPIYDHQGFAKEFGDKLKEIYNNFFK